jgi:multiple sugar transport system permease protein
MTDLLPAPAGTSTPHPPHRHRRIRAVVKHAVLILVALVMLYPVLWMVSSSFKPTALIFRDPALVPREVDLSNYSVGWNALDHPFTYYLLNSSVVVAGTVLGNLVSCSLAAYAFARLHFRWRRTAFAIMLLSVMLPIHVIIVPQYIMFSNIGWINTYLPLVVPKMLATTAIFTFIWTWNDFFSQLIFLTNPDRYTVPVALQTFMDSSGESAWGPLFAMSIVSLVPVFLVFLFGQRFLIRGIATTGIK